MLRSKIRNKVDLEQLLNEEATLRDSFAEEYKSKPEQFTKENIIEELFNFLGFDKSARASETELMKSFGRNYPDYKLMVNPEFHLLVEAEPLNSDLHSGGHGLRQVEEWLQNKACTTNFGIATDGFRWHLVEYRMQKGKTRPLATVDISLFFKERLGYSTLVSEKEKKKIFEDFFRFFSKALIEETVSEYEVVLENFQEEISKKFYDTYMRLVFGTDKSKICLVNCIDGVDDLESRKKIAQVIVDRLIFINSNSSIFR